MNKKLVKIGIVGIAGKMGISIARTILKDREIKIEAACEKREHVSIGKDIGSIVGVDKLGISVTSNKMDFFKNIDLVIEFGLGDATREYLQEAKKNRVAFLSGSTGLDKKTQKQLKDTGKYIPVFWSPNMSIGANLLKEVSGYLSSKISADFDIDITDLHHKEKKDTPSGTAISIKKNIETKLAKTKKSKNIKVTAFRSGDSTGEHAVIFSGIGERIEIKHISTSRDIFSIGAVKIAKWLSKKRKGYFDMQDYLSS